MQLSWLKALGVKTFLVLSTGKLFNTLLNWLNYYNYHLPLKKEISELADKGYVVKRANSLLSISSGKLPYNILIRPLSSDKKVLSQIWEQKEYSPLIKLIEKNKAYDSIKTIVDAGSNIGLTSLFLNQYFKEAKIIAIEPDPSNFELQLKNIQLNNLHNTYIKSIKKALWKNSSDKLSISNSFRDGDNWAKCVRIDKNQTKCIEPITLSQVINSFCSANIIDILKIDIEGTENVLFKDLDFIKTLEDKVRFLSLEIHDEFGFREQINQILLEANFTNQQIGETTFCVNKNLL